MDRHHDPRPTRTRPPVRRWRGLLLPMLAAGALAPATPADVRAAGPDHIRLELARPQTRQERNATRRSRLASQPADPTSALETVRLEGTLLVARDGAIRLGDQVVLLGSRALALPDTDGRLLTPDAWDGRTVTLFGKRTTRGVRVSLLIDHGVAGGNAAAMTASVPKHGTPSTVDPQVGELSDAAPQ